MVYRIDWQNMNLKLVDAADNVIREIKRSPDMVGFLGLMGAETGEAEHTYTVDIMPSTSAHLVIANYYKPLNPDHDVMEFEHQDFLGMVEKVKGLRLHPETLMTLAQISGGVADNVIPDKAEAVFSFRVSPNDKNDYLAQIKEFSSDKIAIEAILNVGSIKTDVPKELDFIKTRRTVKYFTELSILKNGAVIGPGDIKYAHGPNEQVLKQELAKAVEVYSQIVKNFA